MSTEPEKCPHCGVRTDHGHDPNRCDPHTALVNSLKGLLYEIEHAHNPKHKTRWTGALDDAKAALKLAEEEK